MSYVEWTPDMGEISGFGGSYEEGCRLMVKAGVEFWEAQDASHARGEREKFDPHYRGYKGIYGILTDSNDDAKALDRAMLDAPITVDGETTTIGKYGATGAMHQASVGHVMAFHRLGAEKYCAELREREAEEQADDRA